MKKWILILLSLWACSWVFAQNNSSRKMISVEEVKQRYKNVQKLYLRGGGYEVLTDKDAFYISNTGEKKDSILYTRFVYCGTGQSYYSIEKTDQMGAKFCVKVNRGCGAYIVYLKGLPEKTDSVSFLNRHKTYIGSHLKHSVSHRTAVNRMIVYSGGKEGLYTYHRDEMEKIPLKEEELNGISYCPPRKFIVHLHQDIPIDKHYILQDSYNGAIEIWKKKRCQLLIDGVSRKYRKVKKKTFCFYKVYKKGKSGFLDVYENKEYGFSKK